MALGLLFAGLKWREKFKQKLPQPEERKIRIWPHDRVGDIIILGAIFGFLGAKIFNSLETWDEFIKSPVESLLSFSGLTFYGGLIVAALSIWFPASVGGLWSCSETRQRHHSHYRRIVLSSSSSFRTSLAGRTCFRQGPRQGFRSGMANFRANPHCEK